MGSSVTIPVEISGVVDKSSIRLAVDDDGSSKKSTQLCSGTVERLLSIFTVYLPVIQTNPLDPREDSGEKNPIYLPLVSRQ